jgi:hypothetical protein
MDMPIRVWMIKQPLQIQKERILQKAVLQTSESMGIEWYLEVILIYVANMHG